MSFRPFQPFLGFGGGAAPFNPLSLSPALWLDAADASTLYDATTGGSLVAADGAVARWEDKSGNERHATQAGGTARPLRKASIQNGLDILRFDGSNDFLTTVAFSGNQTWSRYVVFVSLLTQLKMIVAWGANYNSPNPGADFIYLESGNKIQIAQNGGSATSKLSAKNEVTGSATPNAWKIVGQSCDGTHANHNLKVNGSAPSVSDFVANNPGTFSKSDTAYGIAATNSGASPARIDFAELIHVPRLLTASEKTSIEIYLGTKWGISVP